MGTYQLMAGNRGWRIVATRTGEVVVLTGRVLDNLSEVSARDIVELLERRDRLRREHLQAAAARNDLVRRPGDMHPGGG